MPASKKAKIEKVAGMSNAAVEKRTGKDWSGWLAVLDKAGAHKWPHRDIADYLYKRKGVDGWWAQMVTVGYERARGLREKHEKPSGFEISASRTLSVPLAALYEAWEDHKVRARWLKEAGFAVRKATENKTMRITWVDGETDLNVYFNAKGPRKSQVSVQHGKLSSAAEAAKKKSYWAGQLERLRAVLEER